MKAQSIVTHFLQKVTSNMHAKRRVALSACIMSILDGSDVTVTRIGRGISGSAYEKHKIKRADRLCSNPHMQQECHNIYFELCHHFSTLSSTPIILVDWSDLDDRQEHFLLSASIAFDGRGLPIYQEIHDVKTKDKPQSHKRFLNTLKSMLPPDTKPIIVTDAGYRCPWFKLVQEMGWDFIGRIRNKTQYQKQGDDTWAPIKSLYPGATAHAKLIGRATLAKANPVDVNLVLYKKPAQGRHKYTRKGSVAKWTNSKLAAKREKEPWLLATSLTQNTTLAKRVVKIYSTRMQIEENFRDIKSHHYGIGFSTNRTRNKERLSVIFMFAVLASIILLFIGLVAERNTLQRQYQSTSVSSRRVLSFHYLGRRVYLNHSGKLKFASWKDILLRIKHYHKEFEEAA